MVSPNLNILKLDRYLIMLAQVDNYLALESDKRHGSMKTDIYLRGIVYDKLLTTMHWSKLD